MHSNLASAPALPANPSSAEKKSPEVWKSASSTFNYYFGYVSSPCIILWLFSRAFIPWPQVTDLPRMIGIASAGLIFWTLVEYWFHRLLYHRVESVMRTGHLMHHDDPKALLGIPYYYHGGAYIL